MAEPPTEDIKEETPECIIIHPGSHYLRIGRPSDVTPHTVLHAIACRRKPEGQTYSDKFLIPFSKLDRQTAQDIEECRLKASHLLQSSLMSDGSRRFATPCQQIAAFNKRCQIKTVCDQKVPDWSDNIQEFIIGDDVMRLKPGAPYNIHFPYKKGDLNVHSEVGGSLTSVISHLRIIWTQCISEILKISLDELKFYRVLLIIPDIYDRTHVKYMTNMLLNEIGFGACLLFQDHVAATFGAGLGAACVLDVGEDKASISCVEDAISHTATRIRLTYGGGDVTQLFHWLMKKSSFPHNFNQNNKEDITLLNKLKQDFCHLDLDLCGAQEKSVSLLQSGEKVQKFDVQAGDEMLIAPLSYFMPDLLRITGPKQIIYQAGSIGDSDDPFDDNFLREISRIRNREALDSNCLDNSEVVEEEMVVEETSLNHSRLSEVGHVSEDKLISIDEAILASIDKCSSDEMKRKMYSTILVVGGGAKFCNFGKWLHNKLALHIPVSFRGDPIEIITKPKELDPCMTAWKGASLMSGLEGSSEHWVYKDEWNTQGVRALRERCPFYW